MAQDKVKEAPTSEGEAGDGDAAPGKKKPSLKMMLIAGAAEKEIA